MTYPIRILAAVILGALLGAAGVWLLSATDDERGQAAAGEREPLYWVAPMDPSYRRDGPGKSPMGMDLVPVYAETSDAPAEAAGTVRISPAVINNLGVRTARVEQGQLPARIVTVGHVQYDQSQLVHIHPRVEGWIETLHVKADGDPVNRGQPLYSLYSPTLVNAQEELLLALKRDNPQLIEAALARLRALQVPEAEVDRLRRELKVRQTVTIAAPQTGVVDNLAVREGMFVGPGMSLMTLGDLTRVWVVGEVFEREAALVQPGDRVRMNLDYLPGREWTAEVGYVYPSLNETTRTVRIRVPVDNPDGALKPGMYAQLQIESGSSPERMLVPREALIRTGDDSRVVLALGEGRFRSVTVEVGRVGDRQVEILEGLRPGQRVVTSAQFLIDSESSKRADLQRMEGGGQDDHAGHVDGDGPRDKGEAAGQGHHQHHAGGAGQ